MPTFAKHFPCLVVSDVRAHGLNVLNVPDDGYLAAMLKHLFDINAVIKLLRDLVMVKTPVLG